jgi:hypothetical protein
MLVLGNSEYGNVTDPEVQPYESVGANRLGAVERYRALLSPQTASLGPNKAFASRLPTQRRPLQGVR